MVRSHSYGGDKSDDAMLMQIVSRIRQKAAFATLHLDDRPVAWGLGVAERGYMGLYDIVVAPDLRGIGLGRRVVGSLIAWGCREGAHSAYLQVRAENEIAGSLYSALGFERRLRIHPPPHAGRRLTGKSRHQRAEHDQPAGERERERRIGVAARDQQQRRQHRRRVGGDAEKTDVAALHADIPHIKRCADRADSERRDASHCVVGFGQTVVSNSEVADRGSEAMVARQKPATASVGTSPEAARQHRIGGPHESRHEGAEVDRAGTPARASKAPRPAISTTTPAKPRNAPIRCARRRCSPGSSEENSTMRSGQR